MSTHIDTKETYYSVKRDLLDTCARACILTHTPGHNSLAFLNTIFSSGRIRNILQQWLLICDTNVSSSSYDTQVSSSSYDTPATVAPLVAPSGLS